MALVEATWPLLIPIETDVLLLHAVFEEAICTFHSPSKVAAAACEGLARNPGARPGIQLAMLLGLVFIETLALFTFAMIFAKVKVG